jgi:MFS family permease
VTLLSAETFLEKADLRNTLVLASTAEVIAILMLASSHSPIFVGLGFIIHQGAIGFLFYLLDIFLEREMKDENTTGEVRGIFLTISNIALVASPIIAGAIIGSSGFTTLYLFSIFILLLSIPIHFSRNVEKHLIPKVHAVIPKTLRLGIALNFLLQFFYAWMVVWTPIYLNQVIGFSWPEIGIIFSIMLLPFALFELPLGELGDLMFGEKEIMAIGFFISAISTACLALLSGQYFVGWVLLLFLTRTGASAIEISTESYFFKHVQGSDTGTVGIFRTMKPLSYIVAPAIGALSIYLIGFGPSFVVLGVILFIGAFGAMRLKDSR